MKKKLIYFGLLLISAHISAMEVDDQNENPPFFQVINKTPQSVLVKFKTGSNNTVEQYMVKREEVMRCSQTLTELFYQQQRYQYYDGRYVKIKDDRNNKLFRGNLGLKKVKSGTSYSIVIALLTEDICLPGKGKHKWGAITCTLEEIEQSDVGIGKKDSDLKKNTNL